MAIFPSSRHGAVGQWLLLVHLVLSPLLFCRGTLDSFEENKVALLTLTAVSLAALGVSAWMARRAEFPVRLDLVTLGFLLFASSAILSTMGSISPRTSWRGAAESHAGLLTVLGYVVLFLATRTLCQTVADGRRLLTAAVVASAATSTYALLQSAGQDPVAWGGTSDFAGGVRPFAMLGHPNLLAAYLVMAWPVIAAFVERAGQERRWPFLGALTLVGLLGAAAVIAALSRAAWLAGSCMLLVLLAFGWRSGRRKALFITGMVGLVGAIAGAGCWVSPALRGRLVERVCRLTETGPRSHVWRAGWDLFRERPILGWGMDTFRLAFGRKRPPEYWQVEWNATPTRAHNELLHVLATQGLVGGAAVLILLIGLGQAAWQAHRGTSREDRFFVTAVIAGTVAFLVQDGFGFTTAGCGTLFVTFAALLSRWAEGPGIAPAVVPLRTSRMTAGLLTGSALALAVFLLNTGMAGWAAACVVAFSGGLALWALIHLEGDGKPEETAEVSQPPRLDGWRLFLARTVLATGVVGVAVVLVFRPILASAACRTGDRLMTEDPIGALAWYVRAVALDPEQTRSWMKLAGAVTRAAYLFPDQAERDASLRRARQALERGVELVPADPYAHANLARLLGEMARLGLCPAEQAQEEWSLALDADPNNACFLAEAARTALALNDRPRARQLAERGVALYPDYGACRAQLGLAAYAEGDFRGAERLLTAAANAHWYGDDEGLSQALTALSAAYLGLKMYDHAHYEAALAAHHQPGWPTPHLLLAQALEALGRGPEAKAEYRRTLDLAPHHPAAQAALRRLEEGP
jgi:O-antigen ligase